MGGMEPDVTSAFTSMALHPFTEVDVNAQHFQLLERFTIVLYSKTSDLQHVNDARKEIFCQKGKACNGRTSPYPKCTIAALEESCISGIWCTSEQSKQNRPTPCEMVGAGHLMRTVNHGFQYGTQYLWPRRPAVNLLSVAARAKGDVVLGHVTRQTGGAAVVIVKKTSNHIH